VAKIDYKTIEQLCLCTWEPLYRFVYYKVQNREEAEEITQETYIKAIAYMKKKDVTDENMMGFLKTISLNVIRDRWRKHKRRSKLFNFGDMDLDDAPVEDPTDTIGKREAIENALMGLSEEQRRVIELRIIKGYSVADTAKVMNITESNVRVLQYRALQKLGKALKNECYSVEDY